MTYININNQYIGLLTIIIYMAYGIYILYNMARCWVGSECAADNAAAKLMKYSILM